MPERLGLAYDRAVAGPGESPVWEVASGRPLADGHDARLTDAMPPDAEAVVAALRRPPFPIFSLPDDAPGRRYVRGWQTTGGLVTAVELAVSDEPADRLVVVSSSPRRPWGELEKGTGDDAVVRLAMAIASQPGDLTAHALERRSLALPIGENLVTFGCATHGRISVLWSSHGPGILVQARTVAPEDVELVPLADAGPYVEGSFP
jgi:hypothetical protein